MGTFDIHSDLHDLPELQGPEALAAVGLFTLAGTWTSANGQTGFVPDAALVEIYGNPNTLQEDIDRLITAGLWQREKGGYRMLLGPHSDPNLPLPLWRYGDGDLGGRLFAVDDTPNN